MRGIGAFTMSGESPPGKNFGVAFVKDTLARKAEHRLGCGRYRRGCVRPRAASRKGYRYD